MATVFPARLLTDVTVALLLGKLNDRLSVLRGLRVCGQLAQHRLSLCVRLHSAGRDPHAQPWRTQAVHHNSFRPNTPR